MSVLQENDEVTFQLSRASEVTLSLEKQQLRKDEKPAILLPASIPHTCKNIKADEERNIQTKSPLI
jgi:hypothetical protein